MKQKKVWKSAALDASNRSVANKIRDTLIAVAKGLHPAIQDVGELYDLLAGEFEKIEQLEEREALELLAWFLNCSAFFNISEDEDDELSGAVEDLFADVVALFSEKAKKFDNRDFVKNLQHDLVVNSVGEDARTEEFLSAHEFLSAEEIQSVVDEVMKTVAGHDLENEEEIYTGLLDMTDGAGDAPLYEKIAFLRDPDRSNRTNIDVANAYYVVGDVENAKRLLDEVLNPGNEDEEEFLDLKIGILFKEEKKKEALEMAEQLYEKFPKEYHLMSLCQVVTPARKEVLLDAHEQFRLGVYVSPDYVNMLATLGEFDRLERYLEKYKREIRLLDGQVREDLANRLESLNRKDLAKFLRRI